MSTRTLFVIAIVTLCCTENRLIPSAVGFPTTDIKDSGTDDFDVDNNQLLTSFVVFRHGDRTPDPGELEVYPAAHFNDSIFYPFGQGALTNIGKQRAFSLGQYLRQRYNDTISQLYMPEEITVRTTDYPRTKMTALVVLAGLYPPLQEQKWHEELNWQPIPYDRTESKETDDLLHFGTCPRYQQLKFLVYQVPEKRNLISSYEPLFKLLEAKTGANITIPQNVFYLDNMFTGLENAGLKNEKWVQEVMPKIKEITKFEYSCIYYNDEMITLSSGVLMNEIVNAMKAIVAGSESKTKLHLYSAHENNVAAVLAALKVFDPHQPKYCSSVALELRKNVTTGKYGVVLVYAPEAGRPGEVLPISGCGGKPICDFEIFVTLVQNVLLPQSDYKKRCVLR